MTNLIAQVLNAVALVSYITTCAQLLCYRRGYANYRMHISFIAWLLIVFTGTCALETLLGQRHITLGQAGIAITLCALVYRAQGNVANIIRGNL